MKGRGWTVTGDPDQYGLIHVYPTIEKHDHELSGWWCPCAPAGRDGKVVIHNMQFWSEVQIPNELPEDM